MSVTSGTKSESGLGETIRVVIHALLIALADLSVQFGTDDVAELELSVKSIAEQFIKLYWRQCAPYGLAVADGSYGMLMQNTGGQASVISIVGRLRENYATLTQAKDSDAWSSAVTQTARLIETMPLWRLQVLRNEDLTFLYSRGATPGAIQLKPGVAASFRRFHGMIVRLAQSEWMRFVQALPSNSSLLGATSDLGQFLFGAERAALIRMAAPLADVQQGLCFYCNRRVNAGEVDHFVPWSRYPRDLAHNLVLAHKQCNRQKSDLLAAEDHLDRWIQRNDAQCTAISEAGRNANIIVDLPAAMSVAKWAYSHGADLNAAAWVSGDTVEHLSDRWRMLLYA